MNPGDTFGRYTIEALLGEGGMGSVYRAIDTKLERRVALKVLRRAPSSDAPERTKAAERLLREARAAALIEHPNAVAVHDVGEVGDVPYIAMELVVGRSLRAYVGDANVALSTRLRWLADVGSALSAAHARGVVHRDVKPENVMVREDGAIKVLDFGIAWMHGAAVASTSAPTAWSTSEFEAWHATISREGAIVGTPRYMSPEQAHGREGDSRVDQFGWGVMAYELLAGVPPWPGDTVSYSALLDTLEKDPQRLGSAVPGLPAEVEAIVHRAMAKDPAERFPSMAALVDELGAVIEPRASPARRMRRPLLVGAVATTLAVAGAALYAARASSAVPSFHPTHIRRVTFSDGCEEFPSFTPDGKTVVFDEVRGPSTVVVALDLASGSERAITDGTSSDLAAQVSPDGTQVAFLRAPSAGTPAAMIVDIDGKRPPRLVREGWMRPTFSPDGSALWCGDTHHPARVDLATGNASRTLDMPTSTLGTIARELGDGRVVLVAPMGEPTSLGGLVLFDRAGSPRWLTKDNMEEAFDVTSDERFVIASRVTPAESDELIAVPLAGGAAFPVGAAGVAPSQGLRFDPDRSRIAWSTCHDVTSLVRVNDQGAFVPLHETHAWKESGAAPIPGTRKLVVLSERGGENAPWVVDRDDREPPRKLPVTGSPLTLSVSPDGRLVALVIAEQGIVVASIDGAPARTLTSDASDAKPRFSRDGRTVVFVRSGASPRVFAVDTSGGEARPLLDEGSSDPAPSPTDDRIAYVSGTEMTKKIPMIFDPTTGRSARLSPELGEGSYGSLAFTGDGRRVGLLTGAAGNRILEVDATSGAVLRTIEAGASTLFRLAYDANDPILGRAQWVGNVWLADGPF